ncbi:hypothetical protein [Vibrio sp. SCSIO 43136]|uniref:hypothetical protein n=1 Tax=Vibrio sp. SCSIO 43136 TaxID=2819101 RepID=UPI002075184E|nr:hypothetical protein [Vibrio sp. SCSIO 43136]USD64402.1 hypothetical protein J4N39_09825 [Vibrio sp. SCSIO 43136]
MRISTSLLVAALAATPAFANDTSKPDLKLGFGYDQGFSFLGQYDNKYNFAIGNNGVAVDYLFHNEMIDQQTDLSWYIGAGGWIGWREDGGVRTPIGVNWKFAQGWDGYAQLTPGWNILGDKKLGVGAGLGVRFSF